MDRWEREALDRHITGNYGEDQFKDDDGEEYDPLCGKCGSTFSDHPTVTVAGADGEDYETVECP